MKQKEKQKKIAVVGISRGAGTTFVSITLAFLLSMSNYDESDNLKTIPIPVSYVEWKRPAPGETQVFFSAGLDRRFGTRRFTDFFALYAQGKWPAQKAPLNLHKGINWVVWRQGGKEEDGGDFPLESLPGKYVVTDSPPLERLRTHDLTVAVIDPLPSAVYAGAEIYEAVRDLEYCGLPVIWIVNKDGEAVNHGALKRFLRLKDYVAVPWLTENLFSKAQYGGQLPAELMDDGTKHAFQAAAAEIIRLTADQMKEQEL